jgi:hypothetical protein
MTRRGLLSHGTVGAGIVIVVGVTMSSPPSWAGSTTQHTRVAVWQLNEGAGASVMKDNTANHRNGRIGDAVTTAFNSSGATGYHWTFTRPNQPPPKPERLVVVKEDDAFDPGRGFYGVTIRYRTTHSFGNIIQKGQHGAAGGYWKIQQPHGIAQCHFSGPNGVLGANSHQALDDGEWHLVRCERTADGITMTVDGVVVDSKEGSTGPIDNSRPLTIGGKRNCDQDRVTCDYFVGEIDRVRILT